jgi:hypothetical protein
MLMPKLFVVIVAAVALLSLSCGDDDDAATTTTTTAPPATDLLAEATTVAVAFFEAQAVNDYERARSESTGAAAIVIGWAEFVNDIEDVSGTEFAVERESAPNVRVQLDAIDQTANDTYEATGFIELDGRPGGLDTTTTTTTTTTDGAGLGGGQATTFVVDLRFSRDGDELLLTDYRLDDIAYPVSELYTDFADESPGEITGTTTEGPDADGPEADGPQVDVTLRMAHREVTGPVQYAVTYQGEAELDSVVFIEGDGDGTTTTAPPNASGESVDVYTDDGGTGERHALLVRSTAFPGEAGILRLTFVDDEGRETVVDVAVPDFPDLDARPVNEVRDRLAAETTTTTTTTTPDQTSTTTTAPTTTAGPTTTETTTTTTTSTTTTTPG